MSIKGHRAMSALIERFCDGHCERDPEGPLVTTVEGGWAYCAGHGESGHQWRAIDPRPRQQLEADIAAGLV